MTNTLTYHAPSNEGLGIPPVLIPLAASLAPSLFGKLFGGDSGQAARDQAAAQKTQYIAQVSLQRDAIRMEEERKARNAKTVNTVLMAGGGLLAAVVVGFTVKAIISTKKPAKK